MAKFLLAGRWPLLVLGVLLAVGCFWPSRALQFDRSIENMFASGDPLLPPYARLKQVFGGNEVVVAVYSDPQLLEESRRGVDRLADISRELQATPGVRAVVSLSQIDELLEKISLAAGSLGVTPPAQGIVDSQNALARRFRQLFEGYTHGSNGRTAGVICMLETDAESVRSRQETVDTLRDKIARLAGGTIAGEPVMVADGFRYVEEDGRRLGWTSTILLSLFLLLCFRSVRWMILAVSVVQLALLATRALLAVSGMRLSMVSSMLTAIVTVVGIATVIHVIERFREARATGMEPLESFRHTAAILVQPVFWACATDAMGFASLLVAKVGPVSDFGLMMALGSVWVLVSVLLVAPGLTLGGRHPPSSGGAVGRRALDRQLDWSAGWLQRRPKTILLTALGLSAVASAGAYRLELETDFTRNFRAGSRIVQAYATVETELGGAGIWDLVLPAPERLDYDYLQRVRRLERRLQEELAPADTAAGPAVRGVSIADAVWAGIPHLDRVRSAVRRNIALRATISAMRAHLPAFTAALHAEDPQTPGQYYYRIMLRSAERQSAAQKARLIAEVTRIAREEFPEAEVTGFFVLLTHLIASILRDQWVAFVVALSAIGISMLVAFRRLGYAAITMVPNVLPIMTITGVMGWLGLKINMGAAMIAAVTMGLSVDSSIHYLYAYLRARSQGKSVSAALGEVQLLVGHAMIFSTLALIAGFSVLATSEFVPTIYFGVLMSLTMLGGLACNLVIFPLLVTVVDGHQRDAGGER
jgi:predicted RND superfamily exporter protein